MKLFAILISVLLLQMTVEALTGAEIAAISAGTGMSIADVTAIASDMKYAIGKDASPDAIDAVTRYVMSTAGISGYHISHPTDNPRIRIIQKGGHALPSRDQAPLDFFFGKR